MDRRIVYPGAIPLDTDLLSSERDAMVAIGYLAQATLGTGVVADGLSCVPTSPASMSVAIGAGSITQFASVDTSAFGSLPAEPAQPLLRMGINLNPTSFALTAPTTPGYATNFLVEAALLEEDTEPVVLPYYNAANPGQPYSGPANTGSAQNTMRTQSVQLQVKGGAPNLAGSQLTPSVDAGWVGLYVITVDAGQTSITASSINTLATAPFLTWKLPQLTPGTHNLAQFTPTTQGEWVAPAGISSVRLRIWGGGGAGGSGGGGAGGGGAGGGYAEGYFSVQAGQAYQVSVGNGGAGSGTAGGNSSFGSLCSASGGAAGANGSSGSGGSGAASGGAGSGQCLTMQGESGGSAFVAGTIWVSGRGGAAFAGGGAEPVLAAASSPQNGHNATLPGSGGSGGIGTGLGGQGGPGLVLVEW